MKQLVLDADLRAKLGGGAAKVTLTDENGKPIGHYVPDDLYQSIVSTLMPDDDPRASGLEDMRHGRVVTTAELLASLHESVRRWEGKP